MKKNASRNASQKRVSQRYPLEERIGHPDFLVGRKNEFAKLHEWLQQMPMKGSQSIALLARKKSGKTAIVQRLFNEDWPSASGEQEIPYYKTLTPFLLSPST